jgi:hypothetical protein
MKYLFHGTQVGNIEELKPMVSLEFVSKVYATDNLAYALVRAGKQLDQIREEYYGNDKPFEIAECYPDAFKNQFDCEGYIYLLDPKDFEYNPETTEYQSDKPVKPVGVIHVRNIWSKMLCMKEAYRFVFDGDEEYWKNVRGGRDGFLERKLKNKQKMLNMRKELQ